MRQQPFSRADTVRLNLPDPSDAAESIFRVGDVLNDVYEIREVLGAGGMGQVFEAHDRLLERRVAIKAAWPHLGAPPLRKEARALAAFRHPSLVGVYTMGIHQGVEYLVMERMYGVSLESLMAQRFGANEPFTVRETLDLLIPIAEGLAVVHRAGLAHRDLKPDNVMLAVGQRVVLMDFGLVLPEFEMALPRSIAGSPLYIAPETLRGDLRSGEGHLADLYAFGVIAYELLTMQSPFAADTVEDILVAQMERTVSDVREVRNDVPATLARTVTSLLAKHPQDRPQHVDDMLTTLRALRAGTDLVRAVGPVRVLIVDDDRDLCRVLEFYVRKALPGAEVTVAHDGEEALTRIRAALPHVMLLDLQMPRMNGIEVCMYLRGAALAPDLTVIATSAGAQPDDVQVLHELGIREFIPKGKDLGTRLAAALARWQA